MTSHSQNQNKGNYKHGQAHTKEYKFEKNEEYYLAHKEEMNAKRKLIYYKTVLDDKLVDAYIENFGSIIACQMLKKKLDDKRQDSIILRKASQPKIEKRPVGRPRKSEQ